MKSLSQIGVWHCLFEQSGTFKKEFIKLGLKSFDYDVLDKFDETDFKCDLFNEIDAYFEGKTNIFKNMKDGEAIIAFFPCIRFSKLSILHMQGNAKNYRGKDLSFKIKNFMRLQEELNRYALLFSKLVLICIERDIPLVIENPYGADHYLTRYFPLLPKIIDMNRREMGDWYKKPTQYFFVNCEPYDNWWEVEVEAVGEKAVNDQTRINKSMIHPQYARNFIKRYLMDDERVKSWYDVTKLKEIYLEDEE